MVFSWAKEEKNRLDRALSCCRREMGQEKLSVYWGLHLRWGISSSSLHHWGHQSLQQHTWHLDGLWRCFMGFIKWCLLHELISEGLSMLRKHLSYIPRNTCSPWPLLPDPHLLSNSGIAQMWLTINSGLRTRSSLHDPICCWCFSAVLAIMGLI